MRFDVLAIDARQQVVALNLEAANAALAAEEVRKQGLAVISLESRGLRLPLAEVIMRRGKRFPTNELSLDHVVPRSQGGQSTWDNIVCACIDCNVRKGGRTPKEAHMALIRRPEKPRRSPLLNLKLTHRKYQSWRTFLDNAYWSVELK